MIKYEDECCGCAVPAYPCLGYSCKNRNVPHLYCDSCGFEKEKLFYFDGEELCLECIEERLEEVIPE